MITIKKLTTQRNIKKILKKSIKAITGNELTLGFTAWFTIMSILTLTVF